MNFLICSDGSKPAEQAVRYGALLAAACQAEVTLLGIVEMPGLQDEMLNSLRRSQQVLQEKGVTVELVTRAGEPVSEIIRQTGRAPYDLVLIGAVQKRAAGAFWVSAKAYKLIRGLPVPVLVVLGQRAQIGRVLVCSGGATYFNKSLAFASQLASGLHATVKLVHVLAQPPLLYSAFLPVPEDAETLLNSPSALGRSLAAQKQSLEAAGLGVEVKLRQGPVIRELLAELREGGYDLVVAGFAATPGPVRSYWMGDVTRELVNRADCPLLVVRGEGPPGIAPELDNFLARLRRFLPVRNPPPD